eukprot:g2032.t1
MLAARAVNSTCSRSAGFGCIEAVQVKTPRALPGTVLVRVNQSSVNPSDVDLVVGRAAKLVGTLGADFSGTVVEVGLLCSGFKVGDLVWGVTKGAYAEYQIAVCHITGKLPPSSGSHEESNILRAVGTLPEVGMTSAEALKKAGAPWDRAKNLTVVVTSGSGGTGFVGIQLAKAYGAGTVVTATSGAANEAFVKRLGADIVVDYKASDVFSALGNDTVDIVYDNYGAPGTADRAMPKLRAGGTFIFLPGKNGALSKHPKPGVRQINYGLMVPSKDTLDELLALYLNKSLVPHVEHAYPLSNVSGAFAESSSGHVVGKLAIDM